MDFTKNDFVFHSTYGVGRVSAVVFPEGNKMEAADVSIDFGAGGIKTFAHYLLEHSCHKISPLGFRAFAYLDPAGAARTIQETPMEAIVMALQDFPGLRAKTDDLKYYLSPYVSEWRDWWKKVQLHLKDDARIDTSWSREQEYGIHRELTSRAEEIYLGFNRVRAFETPERTYDQARRVLVEHLDGQILPPEHLEDVLEYVRNVVQSNRHSIQDRLDALFRLLDGKWIEETEAHTWLESLLDQNPKLYNLGLYALNRLVEYLLKHYFDATRLDLISTGMCSTETVCIQLTDWALKRGDDEINAKMLRTGLVEYLPPALEEDKFPALIARWKECGRLILSISHTDPAWKSILESFFFALKVISQLPPYKASLFLPAIGDLVGLIYRHVIRVQNGLETQFLEGIIDPEFPLRFQLDLLEIIRNKTRVKELANKLEDHLWLSGKKRKFDFLGVIGKGDNLEQAANLIRPLLLNDHPLARNMISEKICDLAALDQRSRLVSYLPYLNQIYNLTGTWDQPSRLEGLREEALLASFEETRRDRQTDPALISAVRRFTDLQSQGILQELKKTRDQLTETEHDVSHLETLVREKETVINELRSGFGSDTAEARFEERTRILKEIATSLAEFERVAITNPEQSRGVDALIKRFYNILAGLKVTPMEAPRTQVAFNVQKHRLADTVHVDPGETVIVFERGFLIRDSKDQLRLLKQALVMK